jgi:hypothetical protein
MRRATLDRPGHSSWYRLSATSDRSPPCFAHSPRMPARRGYLTPFDSVGDADCIGLARGQVAEGLPSLRLAAGLGFFSANVVMTKGPMSQCCSANVTRPSVCSRKSFVPCDFKVLR